MANLASPVAAQKDQSRLLVGNLDSPNPGRVQNLSFDTVQAFTTGNSVTSLASVELRFNYLLADVLSDDLDRLAISIYSGSDDLPDRLVGTLTNPDDWGTRFLASDSSRMYTFTTEGIKLQANTRYFLVVDSASEPTDGELGAMAVTPLPGGEDEGSLPGWSIDQSLIVRVSNTTDDWTDGPNSTSGVLQFRLNGVELPGELSPDEFTTGWLARFGRTVAQQALDGIADRMVAVRTPGMRGTLVGLETLQVSSFSLTGGPDSSDGSLAFWGRASHGGFKGRKRTASFDGEVTTGMLGADYVRGRWLGGIVLGQSESEGDLDVSLTTAVPYVALQVSEQLKLWGAAGYGTGEVTLKQEIGLPKADIAWNMVAAGIRSDLPARAGGPAMAVTSDALWTRTSSEKTGNVAAVEADTARLRIGLDARWNRPLAGGDSVMPRLEVGARHDDGDAETGFGTEIGGGVAWADPEHGLSLDVSGRTLVIPGEDGFRDWSYAAALAYDSDPGTKRGASFSLRRGGTNGSSDALFESTMSADGRTESGVSRWALEAAYGFPAFDGHFTGGPHVGISRATATHDYTLGWRFTPEAATGTDLSFDLRTVRRERDTAVPENIVGVELSVRW